MNDVNPLASGEYDDDTRLRLWCSGFGLISGRGKGSGHSCGYGLHDGWGDGGGRLISSGCGNTFMGGSGKGIANASSVGDSL